MKVDELNLGKSYYETSSHKKTIIFALGNDGNLFWKENSDFGSWIEEKASLTKILTYRFEEVEEKFPRVGEIFYVIGMIGGQHLSILNFEWSGSKADYEMLGSGNIFETEEDAREIEQIIIKEVLKKRLEFLDKS